MSSIIIIEVICTSESPFREVPLAVSMCITFCRLMLGKCNETMHPSMHKDNQYLRKSDSIVDTIFCRETN